MKNSNLTIRILNNTTFPNAYEDFVLDRKMSIHKNRKILSLATLFLNSDNENIRRLGYRIIVIYCNRIEDYKPLYDISMNSGLYPVAQFIENQIMNSDKKNFFTEFNAAYSKNFFINDVFCTIQQKGLIDFYAENQNESLSIVAPTSYGKTDLILQTIKNNIEKNICVITPTKSLLAQTKSRILQTCPNRHIKIITHPEMYNPDDDNVIAVMTQERVLRFLKKDDSLSFDIVIIDEAHGLLHDDDRNMLLASAIMILTKRKAETVFKFLTPFLCDANNIKVRYTDFVIKPFVVTEYIKTEMLYLAELRDGRTKTLSLYDQFLNRFYELDKIDQYDEFDFVQMYSGTKNVVYFNKPKDIEHYVKKIIENYKVIESQEIKRACDNIAEYVHPKYRLIEALKRGVIYHHGGVPEPIRMYVEKLYSNLDEIKYVITSSTLLEGVNLPADKMFILDNKKGRGNLSSSDFKNLIGRVCRFSQIFHEKKGSLKKLEPEIYLVIGKHYSLNANVKGFIQESMYVEKNISDKIENVLLDNTPITPVNNEEFKRANEFVENYEAGIIPEYNFRIARTDVGRLCFENNVTEIDIFMYENEIQKAIDEFKLQNMPIDKTDDLFEIIYKMFLSKSNEESMKRFEHEETRRFYKMFLDWRITNTSLSQMISSFMKYWKGLLSTGKNELLIYVGRWGDLTREGVRQLWTDITKKTDEELINLAIVRIKEEQDYLDNTLLKFIEVLNDLGLIEEQLYLLIKYGTDNNGIITCVRNGISLSLAKLLMEQYKEYIIIDSDSDTVSFQEDIIDRMREKDENEVMICELSYFL